MGSLRKDVYLEIVRLRERVKFNRDFSRALGEGGHDEAVIAHIQEVLANRLQRILDDHTPIYVPKEDIIMGKSVQSLAGTGKSYCQFTIRVSNGYFGAASSISLVEQTGGGCGEPKSEKLVALTDFAFPVNVPDGDYTVQAIRRGGNGGGCGSSGEPAYAHVQWQTAKGGAARNREYGFAFDVKSPELLARL